MEPVITLSHIGKEFSKEKGIVLHGINLTITKGEFVCLIGASGCGKSTLLDIIAGLTSPTEGTVDSTLKIAKVFQNAALFPWLTVSDNIKVGLHAREQKIKNGKSEIAKYLQMVHLEDYSDNYPSDLSGGQRQRVGIARALAANPDILLLDEPFSALDPKTTASLHDDLLTIWKETGITVVMVSHLIEEAVSLADRVVLLKDGTIQEIFPITVSRPRREQALSFHETVMHIRKVFFQ